MTSIQEKIIKPKLGLLELAKQLGSVSQACNVMGYSRDSFYRFKEICERPPFANLFISRDIVFFEFNSFPTFFPVKAVSNSSSLVKVVLNRRNVVSPLFGLRFHVTFPDPSRQKVTFSNPPEQRLAFKLLDKRPDRL